VGRETYTKGMSSDFWLILRKLRTDAKGVATVAPSSLALSRATVRGIDWATTTCVVELGAGTGPITAEMVKAAPPGVRLVVNEFDPDFCAVLRQKFPTVDVFEGDAGRIGEEMAVRGITRVDYVLSGLPLTHFSEAARASVIDQCGRLLGPTGKFRQLTTAPWLYRRVYRRYFRQVRFRLVPWNLPPGGVYDCRGWIEPQSRARSEALRAE
jgi:phospholipid N-methyltransferase